ncbi:stearoyl-9-desaturase [Nannochloropsis oceanica]
MAPNAELTRRQRPASNHPIKPSVAGMEKSSRSSSSESLSNSNSQQGISHLSQEAAKVKLIRDAIRAEDKRLRAAYPFPLGEHWQSAVGLFIYVAAWAAWGLATHAWWHGSLSMPALMVINALAISLLHEMEHDLIHELYFKRSPWVQHVMFAGIWLIKSNASPWWRKYYHLRHHQYSGQVNDVEERLIGLGLPWYSPKRLLVTLTPAGTLLVANDIARDDPEFSRFNLVLCNSPVIVLSTAAMLVHLVASLGGGEALVRAGLLSEGMFAMLSHRLLPALFLYNATVNFPNVLRQSCLVIISTYCHYYGDIPERDVFFQTQILDHPFLWPLQLFCFNFGATHIIHHFVTRQPFYLRQVVAFGVLPLMKAQGCRHNDMSNNFRGNRWAGGEDAVDHEEETTTLTGIKGRAGKGGNGGMGGASSTDTSPTTSDDEDGAEDHIKGA